MYEWPCIPRITQESLHIFQKNVLSNKQTSMPTAKARHTVLLR